MINNLPAQAQWSVKVLQWILNRNLSLDELLTDEDVLSGVVSYFVKKVKIDDSQAGQAEQTESSDNTVQTSPMINLSDEEIKKLNEELDFVRCRLAGADQQRVNEVKRLEERNAELREEVVKLTQKLKASEKEIFESRFSVGKVKADLRKAEEEARDFRRDNERKETKITELEKKIEELKAETGKSAGEPEKILRELDETRRGFTKQIESERTNHDQEKSKLEFLVEERDNALSEAREGQAAATREIESLQKELTRTEKRLALLEMEAIKKGVPMVRIGDQPVVGATVAEAILREKNTKVAVDAEDIDEDNWAKKSKKANRTPEPSSSIELSKSGNRMNLSNDSRIPELGSLEIEQTEIPENVKKIGLTAIDYTDANYILSGANSIADEISITSRNSIKENSNLKKAEENKAASIASKKQSQITSPVLKEQPEHNSDADLNSTKTTGKSSNKGRKNKILVDKSNKTAVAQNSKDVKMPEVKPDELESVNNESELSKSAEVKQIDKNAKKSRNSGKIIAPLKSATDDITKETTENNNTEEATPENLMKFLEVINSGLSKKMKQPQITEAKGEILVTPSQEPIPVGVSVRRKKKHLDKVIEKSDLKPIVDETKTPDVKDAPAKPEQSGNIKENEITGDTKTKPEKPVTDFPKKPVINDDKASSKGGDANNRDRRDNHNSRNRSKSKRRGPISNIPVNLRNEPTEPKAQKVPSGNSGNSGNSQNQGNRPQNSGNNKPSNRHRPNKGGNNSGNRKPDGNKK